MENRQSLLGVTWFYPRSFIDRYFDESRVYIRWGYFLTLVPLLGMQPYAYWSLDRHIAVPFSISHGLLAVVVGYLIYLTYTSKNGLLVYTLTFVGYVIGGTTLNLAALLNSSPPVLYTTAGQLECLLMFAVVVRAHWLPALAYGALVIGVFAYIVLAVWGIDSLDAHILAVGVLFILFLAIVGCYARDKQTFELYETQDAIRELESERARWNKMLTQFLRHEMSNQIAGITTSIQMMTRDQPDGMSRFVDRGIRSVEELKKLLWRATEAMNIDDLVENLDLQPIDMMDLVSELVIDYEGHIPEDKGLEIRNNLSSRKFVVQGDYLMLKQLLRNIVDNALRHSDPGTKVKIVLNGEGSLEIIDEGDPLPDEFEKMFAFGSSTGSKKEGLYGLGLYLARKIVMAHDGGISARSAEGFSGAIFSINLPSTSLTR